MEHVKNTKASLYHFWATRLIIVVIGMIVGTCVALWVGQSVMKTNDVNEKMGAMQEKLDTITHELEEMKRKLE